MRDTVRGKLANQTLRTDLSRRLTADSRQPDPVQAVQDTLTAFVKTTMGMVLRQVKIDMEQSLTSSLNALRGRLYEAQMSRGISKASYRNSVLVPTFKLFGTTVHRMVTESSNTTGCPSPPAAAAAASSEDPAATAGNAEEVQHIQQARREVQQQMLAVSRLLDPAQVRTSLSSASPPSRVGC
jgi:hypothetical protein